MGRKLISLNLALLLTVALVPFGALPVGAVTDANPDGYAVFHKNDGSGIQEREELSYFPASNDRLLLYKRSPFTAEGKAVTSYNSKADGSGTVYYLNQSVSDIYSRDGSAPAELYAQWEDAPGNHILYLYGDSDYPNRYQDANGKAYILKSGYGSSAALLGENAFADPYGRENVVGWKTMRGSWGSNDVEAVFYTAGSGIYLADDLTLFPVFGSFYINFHYEVEDRTTGLPVEKVSTFVGEYSSSAVNAPSEYQMYTEGRVFTGWNSEADGSGKWYPTSGLGSDAPSDLYAQYESLPAGGEYCVLACDARLASGKYREIVTLTDGALTLPEKAQGNTAIAYWTFGGGKNSKVCLPGRRAEVVSGTVITAHVPRSGEKYGIIDGNGGVTAAGGQYRAVSTYSSSGGLADYNVFDRTIMFTKEGHVFTGYKGAKTGALYGPGERVETALRAEAGSGQRADFTAQYRAVTGDYIQYWGNGGRTGSGGFQVVQDGLDLSSPGDARFLVNPFTAPEGQYFLGWRTVPDGGTYSADWYDAGAPVTVTENTVLYAIWGKNRVTYRYTTTQGQATYTSVNGRIRGRMSYGVTDESRLWGGWNTKADGSGQWYAAGEEIPDGIVLTLYETWITLPATGYYYILRGPGLNNGRGMEAVAMASEKETVTLPSTGLLWYTGGRPSDGFLDEADNAYPPGARVEVSSGEEFHNMNAHQFENSNSLYVEFRENCEDQPESRVYYMTTAAGLQLFRAEEVFSDLPEDLIFTGWNTAPDGSGSSYAPGMGMSGGVSTLYAQWASGKMGDVNGDGKLTIADAVLVEQMLLTPDGFTEIQRRLADFNGDGRVTAADVTAISRALVGLKEE